MAAEARQAENPAKRDHRGLQQLPITMCSGDTTAELYDQFNSVLPGRRAATTSSLARDINKGLHRHLHGPRANVNDDMVERLQSTPDPPDFQPRSDDPEALWRSVPVLPPLPADEPLAPTKLKPEGFQRVHTAHCRHCNPTQEPGRLDPGAPLHEIAPGCPYGHRLMDMIKYGHRIPFKNGQPPAPFDFRRSKTNDTDTTAAILAATRLELEDGAIERVDKADYISDRFVVYKRSYKRKPREESKEEEEAEPEFDFIDKPRVVFNLKTGLNEHIPDQGLRYPSVIDLLEHVTPNCFFGSRDLKRGYPQFAVHRDSQQYLCFWGPDVDDPDGPEVLYMYTRLPFGLKDAAIGFCHPSGEIGAGLTYMGHKNTVYLDDYGVVGETRERCQAGLDALDGLCDMCGVAISVAKNQGPSQGDDEDGEDGPFEFLGAALDSVSMVVRLGRGRLQALRAEVRRLLDIEEREGELPLAELHSLASKIMWASDKMRGSRAHMRTIWEAVGRARRHSRTRYAAATIIANEELRRSLNWFDNKLNGRSGWNGVTAFPSGRPVAITVFRSDSSGVKGKGYGALSGGRAFFGRWPPDDDLEGLSTTALELVPVKAALIEWGHRWHGKLVVAGLDNAGAVMALNAGRAKECERSNNLLIDIFDLCHKHNIELVGSWVPRDFNVAADILSKEDEELLRLDGAVLRDHVVLRE